MKFLCVLTVILLNFQYLRSQQYSVKFKSILIEQVNFDEDGNYVSSALDEKNKGIVIVVNTEEKKITFWQNPVRKYDIVSQLGNKHKETEKGNWYSYQIVDDKGLGCVFRIYFLKQKEANYTGVIYIDYKDVCYVYYVKIDE